MASRTVRVVRKSDLNLPERSARIVEKGSVMQAHKFQVGETRHFTPSAFDRSAPRGLYEIVRLLPAEGLGHQYRVKCVADGHERVVTESQLG